MITDNIDFPTIGIDEAGRGPIIGPLVLAAVGIPNREVYDYLSTLDIKDSKKYGQGKRAIQKRSSLAKIIKDKCWISIQIATAEEIDNRECSLNDLERKMAANALISGNFPAIGEVIADGKTIFKDLNKMVPFYISFRSENKADVNHLCVAAASVVAKDTRDNIIDEIYKELYPVFGEIKGGGYLNEPTKKFINQYMDLYKNFPPQTRRSWRMCNLFN
jgi:ribonuclease HII